MTTHAAPNPSAFGSRKRRLTIFARLARTGGLEVPDLLAADIAAFCRTLGCRSRAPRLIRHSALAEP
jgi:hypothetical protein